MNKWECPFCGGKIETEYKTETACWGQQTTVVSNVKCHVCQSCGELFYDFDTAVMLEKAAQDSVEVRP